MKKISVITLLCLALLGLSACGTAAPEAPAQNTPAAPSAPAETAPQQPESAAPAESEAPDETEAGGGKVLIAYFSWSGNTEALAGMIQAETGGDLFEIVPETPYTDDYNALLDQAQQEQRDNARPAIAGQVENWTDYDVAFVGYPNWWSDAPMIVRSFLESYDCTGKTVIPFCTHGGGGFGRSLSSVAESAAGADILDGFEVSGSRVDGAAPDVSAWIDDLGLDL